MDQQNKPESNSKEMSAMVEKMRILTSLIDRAKVVGVELNVMAVGCYSGCFRTLLCTLSSAAAQKSPQTQKPVTNSHFFNNLEHLKHTHVYA